MKVLVTGGLGFIGSNFTRQFLTESKDAEIINVDKLGIAANPSNLKELEGNGRYRFVQGDIANDDVVQNVIQDVDAIVNFAAETHVDRSITEPRLFFESNTKGTLALLEVVRNFNQGAKIIHVSTDEVYGEIVKGSFKENDPLKPSNPYSASKAAAEMLCLAYHRTYGVNVKITRCTNNFGPYQYPEKLIPKTVLRAILNLPIPIYGKGTNIRDWIYVSDHCDAITYLMNCGKAGETYNISSGNEKRNLEVVKLILEIMDQKLDLITFVDDRPGHDLRYSLDSTKIRSMGWTPKHSFSDALRKTIEWYLKNEWWWKPLANEKTLHQTPWKTK